MKNIYVRSIVAIASICLVMGLALAVVYKITKPIIEDNELKKANAALAEIFPDATFEEVFGYKIEKPDDAPKTMTKLYKTTDGTKCVAYVKTNAGYGVSTFAVGIDLTNGTVTGIVTVTYGDSVEIDDKFLPSFVGKDDISAITSASPAKFTKAAVKEAVAQALAYVTGGEVPEPPPPPPPTSETLSEQELAAAFPGGTDFEQVFDNLSRPQGAPSSILALYKTADGSGYVAKIAVETSYGHGEASIYAIGIDASSCTIVKVNELFYADSHKYGSDFLPSFEGKDKELTDVDSSATKAPTTRAALKTAVQATLAYIEQIGGAQS